MGYPAVKTGITAVLAVWILLLSGAPVNGFQNVTYQGLAEQNSRSPILTGHYTLPLETDRMLFVTSFSIPHSSLPFRKSDRGSGEQFHAVASLNLEFFEATAEDMRRPERISISGRNPAGRASWSDTVRVESYDETLSDQLLLEGDLQVELPAGYYAYVMQLARGEGAAEVSARPRVIRIRPYGEKERGEILVGNPEGETFDLLNLGNHVPYGEDYTVLAHLPDHREADRYTLQLTRVRITDEDTTGRESVWEHEVQPQEIRTGYRPLPGDDPGEIVLQEDPEGYSYAVIPVPNRRLPNDTYRIRITANGSGEPVAQRVVRSLWPDMPVSLLNLDVAIRMLRFIADTDLIRDLQRGSEAERERKFREYWSERDPTPDTEFNELMAEYYRRIDFAYEEFSSSRTPGYETDQGNIYIRFGPPQKRERTFPPGEPATEIWSYPDRTFVFRATSGFGEFELVSR